jgi:hypothetical protein
MLKTAYKFHRQSGARPIRAMQLARADVAAGKTRYVYSRRACIGAPFADGLRWLEFPESMGFRFVGFADEIARREGFPRSIDHTGWYTFPNGDTGEVLRGAVYQLPARNGKPVYFPAYREGSETRKGWMDNSGGACMDFSDSMARRQVYYDSPWDAAKAADSIAERQAEISCEFYEADAQAREWQELESEAQEAKDSARELIRGIRSATGQAPSVVCDTLRRAVKSHLREWRDTLRKRQKIADNFHYWKDGKSLTIAQFSEKYA